MIMLCAGAIMSSSRWLGQVKRFDNDEIAAILKLMFACELNSALTLHQSSGSLVLLLGDFELSNHYPKVVLPFHQLISKRGRCSIKSCVCEMTISPFCQPMPVLSIVLLRRFANNRRVQLQQVSSAI